MMKVGIVGLRIGQAFFNVADQMGKVRITAICDRSESLLKKVAQERQIIDAFVEYDDLLKTDIDLVVLATPIQLHGAQAIAALDAGKHVLCQYIAADDAFQAERLIKAVERSGCKYMYIETDCYERKNRVMIELAKKGVFGTLTMGRGMYLHDCKSMGKQADGSLTWRGELWNESPGGRVSAVHNAQPILDVFNERVKTVYAYGPGPRTMPEFCKHDRVTTVGTFPSGGIIEMVDDIFSWRPPFSGYQLQGTLGCFEFDRAAVKTENGISEWKTLDCLETQYGLETGTQEDKSHESAWRSILEAFIHAIQTDRTPPQDLYDALHITAIGWAANLSLKSRMPEPVMQFD